MKYHTPISKELEEIGRVIVDAAFQVHRELGPGLPERIYEACFCYELELQGIQAQRQIEVPFEYREVTFDEGLIIDVLVANEVLCEIKAAEVVHPLWEAQVLSQLKLTELRLGYLINFNTPLIKHGIRRYVN